MEVKVTSRDSVQGRINLTEILLNSISLVTITKEGRIDLGNVHRKNIWRYLQIDEFPWGLNAFNFNTE